ncbi:MAG: zinc ribbon domain-containing protein [Acidobacteria bacterium]|nr:zinc ribbon domain-containing protein [Acidobacteriota bacterium]
MPLYEYSCPECGAQFEQLKKMLEADAPARCPKCGFTDARRQLSCFATGGCGTGGGGRFS